MLNKVATLAPYSNVGSYHRVPPVVVGGLINIPNGALLSIVNISNGAVVKTEKLHFPFVQMGDDIISWGTHLFSVTRYPGGGTKLTESLPRSDLVRHTLTILPGSDLLVASFPTKMVVRNIKTGGVVYEHPLDFQSAYLFDRPLVLAEQRQMVLTNGDKVEVFQF